MHAFFSYIVFLFLSFNVSAPLAAEIVFEPDDSDIPERIRPDFISGSNLPHPIQMREILKNAESTPLGKLLVLGRYFDARYPGEKLEFDFSEDVSLIFPDLSAQELQKATNYIRTAVYIYRKTQEKVKEVQQQALTPKDPPLVVKDDEYAIIGDREYTPTPENQVAVISDFKKVIGYSHNKREIEAMEQWLYRSSQDPRSTDMEKFKQMLSKIEFSKIPAYGVTLPSPFVGNAGIGKWVEQASIKARLISDTARISNTKEIIAALHLDIPNHRIILATNLDAQHQKPVIHLKNAENIESYEVFYPLPVQVIHRQMLGAYRGNFAFPIKLKLIDPNKPISFDAEISFQNCDSELECEMQTLTPSLSIASELSDSATSSSMSNFIHQSLYNIPQEKNKYVKLENISLTENPETKDKDTINFEFKTKATPKNIALFLENEQGTVFSAPQIISANKNTYIKTTAIENSSDFLKKPLTLTFRLNNYATLRQTIVPQDVSFSDEQHNLSAIYLLFFMIGLFFYITPFGFALIALPSFSKAQNNAYLNYAGTKLAILLALSLWVGFKFFSNPELLYFSPINHLFCLFAVFVILNVRFLTFHFKYPKDRKSPVVSGVLDALQIAVLLPFTNLVLTEKALLGIQTLSVFETLAAFAFLTLGLFLPTVIGLICKSKNINEKVINVYRLFSLALTVVAWLMIASRISFLVTPLSLLKITLVLLSGLFVLKYLLYFWEALYKTQLPKNYISITQKILFVVFFGSALLLTSALNKVSTKKTWQDVPDLSDIEQKASNGENILLTFEMPSCFLCKYNHIATFVPSNIEALQQNYKIKYISVLEDQPSNQTKSYLKKYKRLQLPLYVLYTPQAPQGVVLPKLITPFDLSDTLENFGLYPSSSSFKSLLEKRRKKLFR